MSKGLTTAAIIFFLFGCSLAKKSDYTFIQIPDHINDNPRKQLDDEQVKYDVSQLKYSLKSIYSGSRFLPGNQFSNLINEIESIDSKQTSGDLCQLIQSSFEKVSDNHLNATLDDKSCFNKQTAREALVGKNYYKNKSIPWNVKLSKRGSNTALMISILSFNKRSSPVWDGFLSEVKKLLPTSDLVILDMRGNGGGDDTIGYELSALLAGDNIKTPYADQWTNDSPETFQMFVNTFEYWARYRRAKGESVPQYIADLKSDFEKKRDRSLSGEKVALADMPGPGKGERVDFNLENSIKKPIYILIDAKCASSCESTTDYFEYNALVKTVGENTAGYIHFGNNGNVFLKNSGIKIQMAASYNKFKDERFLEKIGITPKIKVPPGKNALEYAWSDFLTKKTRKF